MHAAVLRALGQAPRYETFPDPVPGPGEVIVRCAPIVKAYRPADGQRHALCQPRRIARGVRHGRRGVLETAPGYFSADARRPYGAMAELAVVARARCWPVPEGLDDATAAALPNPALSSWLPLVWRAKLAAGETVLVLGATGIAGKLAIQIAKILGAGRVVAAGRNEQASDSLGGLGADAAIQLQGSDREVTEAFAREAGENGYDVILDYVWGHPTELLLAALTHAGFSMRAAGPR